MLIHCFIVFLATFGLLALGCNAPNLSDGSRGTSTKIDSDPEAAILAFDPQEPDASFERLHVFLIDPKQHTTTADAAARYIQDPDADTRFAAIYLLGNVGNPADAQVLIPALKDPNLRLRVVAAGWLIGWGEKQAIPVLIESLTATEMLPYSDPPTPVWTLAQQALPRYTGQEFGLREAADADAVAATAQAWAAWWQANSTTLRWNPDLERYGP